MAELFFDLKYDFVGQDWTKTILKDVDLIGDKDTYLQIILLRLLIPRGSYLLNPSIGSDLHLLKQYKNTLVTRNQVKTIILSALQPEIDAGNIDSVIVEISSADRGRIRVNISMNVTEQGQINTELFLNL